MKEANTEQKAFLSSVAPGVTIFFTSVCVMMMEIVAGRSRAARRMGSLGRCPTRVAPEECTYVPAGPWSLSRFTAAGEHLGTVPVLRGAVRAADEPRQ